MQRKKKDPNDRQVVAPIRMSRNQMKIVAAAAKKLKLGFSQYVRFQCGVEQVIK